MKDKKTLIENYVVRVSPQGKVSNLNLLDKNYSNEYFFDAEGCVSFGRNRVINAYFLIKNSALSLAALRDTITMLKLTDAGRNEECIKILLTEYLPKKRQEMLRASDVSFIDSVGNAWIDSDSLLIEKCGNRLSNASSKGKIQSVFADKATLVSRLLFNGDIKGVRETSTTLDDLGFSLTPGYISKVVNSLIEEHYAKRTDKGVRLINKNLFLEDWVSAYKKKRNQRSVEGWYCPMSQVDELAREVGSRLGKHGVLTDRSGAHFIDTYATFDSVDVLIKDKDAVKRALKDMGASPVDRGANINLIEPYYSVSAFFGRQEIEGVQIASDIQIYLDLSHQPKRGLEAAEHLYQQKILPFIEREENDE